MSERPFRWLPWFLACALLMPLAAEAELELSGFGTLGGAISDQDFTYQQRITESGTLNRDSVIGFQLDGHFSPEWGVTIQGKAAPSEKRENGWDPTLTWAFLSWRPTNDLLLRAGKLRMPLMLYSANSDVGTTYPFAQMPAEVYSIAPITDVIGLAFSWSWSSGTIDWTLDGYGGQSDVNRRFYLRDGLPGYFDAGPLYEETDVNLGGLVLALRQGGNTWQVGLHRVEVIANAVDFPQTYPWVSMGPGAGYYQLPDMPGANVPTVESLRSDLLTLSAEIALPSDFQLVAEYARRVVNNATIGLDAHSGYVALLRPVERWTPYVYLAGLRSNQNALDLYNGMNGNRVPDSVPKASFVNAAQRFGADRLVPYDQYTLAIGTSYSLTPKSRLKAEFAHTRSGIASSFIDAPTGEDSGDREVNVFSLSYSFTF